MEAHPPLVSEALLAFDAAALLRIEEIVSSPPTDPGSGGAFVSSSIRGESGFGFALRALAAIAPFASDGVVTELIRWHDRERGRGASGRRCAERSRSLECTFLRTRAQNGRRTARTGSLQPYG